MVVIKAKEKPQKKYLNFKEIFEKVTSNSWFNYVVFLYVIAFLAFFNTLANNSFVIPVSGDFVIQEIPFYFNGYDDWWTALKTGHFPLWDESAMLGVNNIGANSFYYLFNIFFLPTLLFPRSWIPSIQALLIISKMVLAGVGMRKLLQVFNVKQDTIVIVGIAYAFCGWNLCYLWFNHFFEIAVLMPFFLLGIEKVLRERKCLPLIFTIAIVGITNYFFLISFCFVGVIYAIFRYFQRFKEMKRMNDEEIINGRILKVHVRVEVILKGIFAFAMGLILACLVLLPCFDAVLSNPRVTNASYLDEIKEPLKALKDSLISFRIGDLFANLKVLFSKILSWEAIGANTTQNQKYLMYPAVSFFFPTITCYDSPLFVNNGFDNHQASLYLYTPLTLMLIPSVLMSIKEKKVSHLLGVLGVIILLFTPFAYYCFSGFTENAYGRWQIFVVAIYCIYCAIQLDKVDKMPGLYFDISIFFTLLIQFFLIQQALKLSNDGASATKELTADRLIICYVMMGVNFAEYLYFRLRSKKKEFKPTLKLLVAVETIVFINVVLKIHGTSDYNNSLYGGKDNTSAEVQLVNRIKEIDDSYYRVFSTTADRTGNNLAMMFGSRGIGTFHSVYDYNLDDFLSWSQVTYGNGGWSMGVHEKRIYLDEFLGIKYYILKSNDTNIPFGFEEIFSTDTHTVYINTNFIELGFSFDKVYSDTRNYSNSRVFKNELSYLNGAIVSHDIVSKILSKYNDITITESSSDSTLTYHEVINPKYTIQKKVNDNKYEIVNSTLNLPYGSRLVVDVSNSHIAEDASTSNPCYIDLQARMGENLMIYFYGHGGKLLTSDNHMTHWYSKNGDIKNNRGFYVTEEVTEIVIELREYLDNNRTLQTPNVRYTYYNDFKENINRLKEDTFEDIKILNTDTISFKTSFDKDKVSVLSIPFDKGWHLKDEFNNDVELFKVNGGFLGFVSEKGNHVYTLTYITPMLSFGLKTTFIGTILVETYYISYQLLDMEKKKRRLLTLGKKKN